MTTRRSGAESYAENVKITARSLSFASLTLNDDILSAFGIRPQLPLQLGPRTEIFAVNDASVSEWSLHDPLAGPYTKITHICVMQMCVILSS